MNAFALFDFKHVSSSLIITQYLGYYYRTYPNNKKDPVNKQIKYKRYKSLLCETNKLSTKGTNHFFVNHNL